MPYPAEYVTASERPAVAVPGIACNVEVPF